MRNPLRIAECLYWLCVLWKKHPDMRFGQLLTNYVYPPEGKIAWTEDDDSLIDRLMELAK